MAFVTPQIIPKKKEGGAGLANWRTSPGLKPTTSPKPLPVDVPATVSVSDPSFDDFILNISVANVIQADIEKVLLPEAGCATGYSYGYLMQIRKQCTIPLDREGVDSGTDSKNDSLSGPALHFKTPKAESVTVGGSLATPDAPAILNKHGLPEMLLPPAEHASVADATPVNNELFVAVYGTSEAADNAKHLIKLAYPKASVNITTRKRGTTNSTLVLKGVPFQTRVDSLVENLTSHLSFKPSYVRLHRSERGVFKCVIFLKFSTRIIAEHAKLELERITVGTRPLRVEYKKQQREAAVDGGVTPIAPGSNVSAPTSLGTLPPPAYGTPKTTGTLLSAVPPPAYNTQGCANTAPTPPYSVMETTVAGIVSGESGGCVYATADLKPEDVRYLAHLCTVSGLQVVPATPSNVPVEANISLLPTSSSSIASTTSKIPSFLLVRKRPALPSSSQACPSSGIIDRSSPQFNPISTPKFTPRVVPATPQWAAHTPSSLQPMDFRGIRHWKEMRQETSAPTATTGPSLGILRPLGPDSRQPFGSGRGRPVR